MRLTIVVVDEAPDYRLIVRYVLARCPTRRPSWARLKMARRASARAT
jgi:hypothetical protein